MCGVYMAVNVKSPRQHGYVFVQISDDREVRRDDKFLFPFLKKLFLIRSFKNIYAKLCLLA